MEYSIKQALEEMNDPFSSESQRKMAENRFNSLVHGYTLITKTEKETGVRLK